MRALGAAACALFLGGCQPAAPEVAELELPAGPGSVAPALTQHPSGGVVLSWTEPLGDGHALRYSIFDGSWSDARTIARGDGWFVNWADFPAVTISADGRWIAHWLQREGEGTYAYGVRVVVSDDDGVSWSQPITPHRDGTLTEHGFVAHYPTEEGFGLVWLDGRNMTGAGHDGHGGHGAGGMTLRHALVAMDGTLSEELVLDDLTCDCCLNDVALGRDGPLVVYRDRTESEVRDIGILLRDAAGWTGPSIVHDDGWEIAACPVNGPVITTVADQVTVSWFTAARGQARMMLARSTDGGRSFPDVMVIDDQRPIGRGDMILRDGHALLSWLASHGASDAVIRLQRADGRSLDVAPVSASRATGVPQLGSAAGSLLVVWTDAGEARGLRGARVEGF